MVAWATSTLDWYWATLGRAGVAAAFLVTLLVLTLFMVAAARLVGAWRGPSGNQTNEARSFLSNAIVVAGQGDKLPEFRGRFVENGRDATFYVEYSSSRGGMGRSVQWTDLRKVPVCERSRFSRGEEIDFPLVTQCEVEGKPRWRFGPPRRDDLPNRPSDLLNPDTPFKGRVIALTADDREQHCYFIAKTDESGRP